MKTIATYCALFCFAALPGAAQINWTGYVGAGPMLPLNPMAGQTSGTGWNVSAGGGVTLHRVGMMVDFLYDSVGINSPGLTQSGATSGNIHTWGFTLDPVVHLTKEGPLDFYATGGGGIYNRSFDFNNPAMPGASSDSVYKGGVDGGLGVSFRLGPSHLKAFAEARYHYIFTAPTATTMIPVTIGLRW